METSTGCLFGASALGEQGTCLRGRKPAYTRPHVPTRMLEL